MVSAAGTQYAADFSDVRDAAARIAPYAHRTPVMTCAALDEMAGRKLFFKCEPLQKGGAFKFRGACSAVMKLDNASTRRGVVTHSSGNHAQAIALAAKVRGIAAHVVMPENAPRVKKAAVEGYGARITFCEPTQKAREQAAAQVVKHTGAIYIPSYDHADIIAGQGTAALELLDEQPELDAVLVPVGGGGLLAGTCLASHGVKPEIALFAGEPAGADDAARSLTAGDRVTDNPPPTTIADGLLMTLGELTWPIVRDHVENIFTVTDEQIIDAMRVIWQRMKILIEPSAAVAVAAVLDDAFKSLRGVERVGVILTGGNVDLDRLPWMET